MSSTQTEPQFLFFTRTFDSPLDLLWKSSPAAAYLQRRTLKGEAK